MSELTSLIQHGMRPLGILEKSTKSARAAGSLAAGSLYEWQNSLSGSYRRIVLDHLLRRMPGFTAQLCAGLDLRGIDDDVLDALAFPGVGHVDQAVAV